MDEDSGACCDQERLDRQRPAGFAADRGTDGVAGDPAMAGVSGAGPGRARGSRGRAAGLRRSGQRRVGDGSGHRHDRRPPGGADQTERAIVSARNACRADPPRAARCCPPARDPLSGNAEHQLHPIRLVGEHAAARRHQRRHVAAAEGAGSHWTVDVRRTEAVRGQNPADRGGWRDGVRGTVKDGWRQRGGGEARRTKRQLWPAAVKPDGIAQYGQGWTDDMFMASSILSRTGHVDDAARLLRRRMPAACSARTACSITRSMARPPGAAGTALPRSASSRRSRRCRSSIRRARRCSRSTGVTWRRSRRSRRLTACGGR